MRGAYQQQFDIGQRTLLDVLDSENEYFEASRAYANAEFDLTLAQARTLAAMGQLMSTLEVSRDDIPSLASLGYEDSMSAEMACAVEGPSGFTLEDFTRGISSLPAHADMPASAYAASEQPGIIPQQETVFSNQAMASQTVSSQSGSNQTLPNDMERSADGGLYIQVASLGAIERAEHLSVQLSDQLASQSRVYAAAGNYRVQVGPVDSLNDAQQLQQTLQEMGYQDAFVTNS